MAPGYKPGVCPLGINPLQVGQMMFLLIAPRFRNRGRSKTRLPALRPSGQKLAHTLRILL